MSSEVFFVPGDIYRCLTGKTKHVKKFGELPILSPTLAYQTRGAEVLKPSLLEPPGGPVEMKTASPTPRLSDSQALGWNLGICISNKFPSSQVS